MQWNRFTKVLALAAVLGSFGSEAARAQGPGPVKVGVIDFQQALLDTADVQKSAEELQAKYAPKQKELEQLSQDLQQLQQKLQAASPDEAASLQVEFQRKQRDAQRLNEDLQADIDYERNEILQRSGRTMREVVAKLAEAKGLDLVVDVGNTVYFKTALDISKEATEAYNQANSAAPAP